MRKQSLSIVLLIVVAALGFLYTCGQDEEAQRAARIEWTTVHPNFEESDERVTSLDGNDGSTTDEGETIEYSKSDLCIAFVGCPGGEREKDFVRFLKAHFREVKTYDIHSFTNSTANEYDVLIFDYEGDFFEAMRLNLPKNHTRPTITLGAAGAFICDNYGLKTGYL